MNFKRLAEITKGDLLQPRSAGQEFAGVSIDSRTLASGQLFVALKGESVDGHAYIANALAKGASGVVVEHRCDMSPITGSEAAVVRVENCHDALLRLASAYRDSVPATRIGISGSNGKTTTKEITYQLLSTVEPLTYRSPGNLNNLYGAPLALFSMPQATKLAILEMGVSEQGEMHRLVEIVQPHAAVITNVAISHLEKLSTLEGVAEEELSLIRALPESAPLLVNADDDFLLRKVRKTGRKLSTFGIKNEADFRPDAWKEIEGGSRISIGGCEFVMSLFGEHQIYNLLAAYGMGRLLGYDFSRLDTAAIQFETAPLRGQRVRHAGVTFILDCYNANPSSMASGLRTFSRVPKIGRKLVVLGDMLELGADEISHHRNIGTMLAEVKFDIGLFVGPLAGHMIEGAVSAGVPRQRLLHFDSAKADGSKIAGYFRVDDTVYLKGSRGVTLEGVFEAWKRSAS